MKILYSWLKDFVRIKETPEKLAEILSVSSFETLVDKKVGKDAVFEISLLPNRVADAASHLGIAREISLRLRRPIQFTAAHCRETGPRIETFAKVKITDPSLVRRYSLRALTDVRIKESPAWLKARLRACGLRPINNVVDATNYAMLELGQPLHAFDADDVKEKTIIVRKAKKGERLETIERKTYTLRGFELLITDRGGLLGLAGVKGGRRGEISKKTRNIFIESANFDPATTRETSKMHRLKTDASWRFENNLDPNCTALALDRAASLIREVAGGHILKGMIDYYLKKALPRPIVASVDYISGLLGAKISEAELQRLLAPVCEKIARAKNGTLLLHIKTYRRDLLYPEDIAEEVARLIGYNAIQPKAPLAPVCAARRNESLEFREMLKDFFVSAGFTEVQNYSFMSERDVETFAFDKKKLFEVADPISSEMSYLRASLLPGLLKNTRDNLRFFDEIRIFELGKHYRRNGVRPNESWWIGGVLSGKAAKTTSIFFEAKGLIESLLERFGFDRDDYRWSEPSHRQQDLQARMAASVCIGSDEVGTVGIVESRVVRAYDIDSHVAYWRLDAEPLMKLVESEHEFEPLHKYPDALRDISMFVPRDRRIAEIEEVIYNASPKYLEEVELFDIYESEDAQGGQKSLAFHLVFRASNRTLTSEEIDKEITHIKRALENLGAHIR